MQKINFQNLPNTTTPVNASNLNQLQTNVETAIGEIIASGSNTNGNYVKYDDGTMICWHRIVGSSFNCSTIAGSGRYYYIDNNNSNENQKQWIYPQEFISAPTVELTVSSNAYSMSSLGAITSSIASAFCVLPYPVSSTTFTWHLVAIGKWK